MKKYIQGRVYFGVVALIVLGLLVTLVPRMMTHNPMFMGEREMFISLRAEIQEGMRAQGDYRCCLEKPCTYCIEKTPGHGEGAVCSCLDDLMNGVHPCGECIGEILEGHGSPYLSKYFANAIAEKVGEQHLNTLQQIIEEKYGIPVDEQYVF